MIRFDRFEEDQMDLGFIEVTYKILVSIHDKS